LQAEILDRPTGHRGVVRFAPGELVEPWRSSELKRVPEASFNRHFRPGHVLEPRVGRYYPKGVLQGVPGVYRENLFPMRVVEREAGGLVCDFNHPLARLPLEIEVAIVAIHPAPATHGGRCADALAELLRGPGMPARYAGRPTDFLSDEPFRRSDAGPDGLFYAEPRLVEHLDARALEALAGLYAGLLRPGMAVLDLMAGANSHLPAGLALGEVTGLGMNQVELEVNPRLCARRVHDLNADPVLPFADESFDAVLCSLSVEYLVRPMEVFREVRRVLKPDGLFVNAFSNRWFPTKAIALWADLHEFERPGLVAEYYLQAGGFATLHGHSLRGLARPEGDPHYLQTALSDPLYALWAAKGQG